MIQPLLARRVASNAANFLADALLLGVVEPARCYYAASRPPAVTGPAQPRCRRSPRTAHSMISSPDPKPRKWPDDHRAPTTPPPSVSRSAAARFLQVSGTPVRKGLRSGLIPDLTFTTIGALASRSIVTQITNAAGMPVPVARLCELTGDSTDPTRTHFGYGHGMRDDEFLAASDRWWPPAGRAQVHTARAMVVAHASFLIGWLHVDLHATSTNADGRSRYRARLVARCDEIVGPTVRAIDPTSTNVDHALAVLGLRVLGRRGGPSRCSSPASIQTIGNRVADLSPYSSGAGRTPVLAQKVHHQQAFCSFDRHQRSIVQGGELASQGGQPGALVRDPLLHQHCSVTVKNAQLVERATAVDTGEQTRPTRVIITRGGDCGLKGVSGLTR
jgi:hypothetical protein